MLKRPALGHIAPLGGLYDARTDNFVPLSALKKPPPDGAVTTTDTPSSNLAPRGDDNLEEKFSRINIDPGLGASFLAGFFDVDGSGRYLHPQRDSNCDLYDFWLHTTTTVRETMNFETPGIDGCLAFDKLESGMATHVVAEISWGSRTAFIANNSSVRLKDSALGPDRCGQKRSALLDLRYSKYEFLDYSQAEELDDSFEFTILADLNEDDGGISHSYSDADNFVTEIPKSIAETKGGKGRPLTYTLLPISKLAKLAKCQISRDVTVRNPSLDCFQKLVSIFDDAANLRRYTRALRELRSGKGDENSLLKITEEFATTDYGVHRLAGLDTPFQAMRLKYVDEFVIKGAEYIGFNGGSFDLALDSPRDVDVYVLYLSDKAIRSYTAWNHHVSLIRDLFADSHLQARVLLKDCDAFDEPLSQPRLALFQNAEEIINNVFEDREAALTEWTARYVRTYLDRSGKPKPSSTVPITIRCPRFGCSNMGTSNYWICAVCNGQIEYNSIDQCIYCDCGRCDYRYWAFRCPGQHHGYFYIKFHTTTLLLSLLTALKPCDEVNILVLNPDSVERSTWINAFTNYLAFSTYSDATREGQQLHWPAPFSFKTYSVNPDGEIEDVLFKVGLGEASSGPLPEDVGTDGDDDKSRVQKTTVHSVVIRNRLIRFINTPGFGEGCLFDSKESIADVCKLLRPCGNIHGVLILLKPTRTKDPLVQLYLQPGFQSSLQTLFRHLHRDAARNIAFGITNRGASIDSMKAELDYYLKRTFGFGFGDARIIPSAQNVFNFDCGSFLSLAAQKQCSHKLGLREENCADWEYSVQESRRLMDYFQSSTPHEVSSIADMYETRSRIGRLAEPMTTIAEHIGSIIKETEEAIEKLEQAESINKRMLELERAVEMPRVQVNSFTTVTVGLRETTYAQLKSVEYKGTGITGLHGNWIVPRSLDSARSEAAISTKRRVVQGLQSERDAIAGIAALFTVFLKHNAIMPCESVITNHIYRELSSARLKFNGDKMDSLTNYHRLYEKNLKRLGGSPWLFQPPGGSALFNQRLRLFNLDTTLGELHVLRKYCKVPRNWHSWNWLTRELDLRQPADVLRWKERSGPALALGSTVPANTRWVLPTT